MPSADTRNLQLQISASAELLIRNLKQADNAVAEFQRSTNGRLASIDARFEALGALKGKLAGLANGIGLGGVVGAVSGASLISLAKGGLNYASSLQEVAQQLGVTSKDLQTYRYAASQVGIEQETMDKGLGKLTQTMGKAELGAEGPRKAFAAIGISLADLKGKTAGDIIPMIADGLSKISDPAQRAAVEVTLFGKAGQMLDTLLAGGSAQINGLAKAAADLGLVLSDEQIANADQTADKLSEVKQVLEANIARVVAENAGAIYQLANAFEHLAVTAGQSLGSLQNSWNMAVLNNPGLFDVLRGASKYSAIPLKVTSGSEATDGLMATKSGRQLLFDRATQRRREARDRGDVVGMRIQYAEQQRITGAERSARAATGATPKPAGNVSQFLASPKSAPKGKSAEQVAREAEAAARKDRSDRRRAGDLDDRGNLDLLSSRAYLANDPEQRLAIERQRIDLARQGRDRDLEEAALDNRYIAANLDKLKAVNAENAAIDKQLLERRRGAETEQAEYDRTRAGQDDQIALLEISARLAIVAKDRHAIEQRILALKQQEEREALERVRANVSGKYTPDDVATADQALKRLPAKQQAERDEQAAGQKGPLARYRDQLHAATDDMGEALENVEVHGLQSLEDGLLGVIDGTESVGSAFKKMASSIVADLARIAIEKAIVSAIGGSLPGFADGGPLAGIPGRADGGSLGGLITGPGTGRSDSILALLRGPGGGAVRLSRREFIMNEKAVAHYGVGAMAAINSRSLPRFADGGYLGGPALQAIVAPRLPSLAGGGRDRLHLTAEVAVNASPELHAEVRSVAL